MRSITTYRMSTLRYTTSLTFNQNIGESGWENTINYYHINLNDVLERWDDENNEEFADRCWKVFAELHKRSVEGVIDLDDIDEEIDDAQSKFDENVDEYICEVADELNLLTAP